MPRPEGLARVGSSSFSKIQGEVVSIVTHTADFGSTFRHAGSAAKVVLAEMTESWLAALVWR